jgi:hypothetical protein
VPGAVRPERAVPVDTSRGRDTNPGRRRGTCSLVASRTSARTRQPPMGSPGTAQPSVTCTLSASSDAPSHRRARSS